MYFSTSSEVFLNRIPGSRISGYLDMSFGNDFFFERTKNVSTQILLTVILGFSHKFVHVVLAKLHTSICSSTFCLRELLLSPMLSHDLDVLKCVYRCHCSTEQISSSEKGCSNICNYFEKKFAGASTAYFNNQ